MCEVNSPEEAAIGVTDRYYRRFVFPDLSCQTRIFAGVVASRQAPPLFGGRRTNAGEALYRFGIERECLK
jgi:hypothetical protein